MVQCCLFCVGVQAVQEKCHIETEKETGGEMIGIEIEGIGKSVLNHSFFYSFPYL